MINQSFFLKRDILIYVFLIFIAFIIILINFFLNYPKLNQNEINSYKNQYKQILNKEKKVKKEYLENQKRYLFYKKYLFTREEIEKIKKILDIFNNLLAKFQVAECRITNFSYDKNYINVLKINMLCNSEIDAKKYILVFKFFFGNLQKHNIVKIQQIKPVNNMIIFKFFKDTKGI